MSELLRGRLFKVWDYCISHPTLLIRSFETDSEPNIDLSFQVVTYFEGPFGLGEIELQEPTEAERARVRRVTDEERIWAIQGTLGRALVAAAGFGIGQNRLGVAALRGADPSVQLDPVDLLEADIAPVDPRERAALLDELAAIAAAHPYLYNHVVDAASDRIILRGGGDYFDLASWFLSRERKIEARIGATRVLHREAVSRFVTADTTHKTGSPGNPAFARVILSFEPKLRGTGASFSSNFPGAALPDAYVEGVAAGVWAALVKGPHGWPVVDVDVTLTDGAYHDDDSSPEAFKLAAEAACRQALRDAGTILLEPMMRIDVSMPAAFFGTVCDDLAARRGRVLDRVWSSATMRLIARAPLANLLGYREQLGVLTQGGAYQSHSMRFDGWQPTDPSPPSRFRPAVALRAV